MSRYVAGTQHHPVAMGTSPSQSRQHHAIRINAIDRFVYFLT